MECRLPMVRDDMDTRERDGLLMHLTTVACVITIMLLILWLWMPPAIVVVIGGLASGFLAYRALRRTLPDWAGPKDLVGELVLTGNTIRMEGSSSRTITLGPAWAVHVASNHIQGKPIVYKDVIRNGLGTLRITGSDEESTVKFVIASLEQQQAMITVMKHWYRSGFRLTESMGDSNTGVFLLRGGRMWSDLQNAKREVFGEGVENAHRE